MHSAFLTGSRGLKVAGIVTVVVERVEGGGRGQSALRRGRALVHIPSAARALAGVISHRNRSEMMRFIRAPMCPAVA